MFFIFHTYLARMWENADQNNYEYKHFLRNGF